MFHSFCERSSSLGQRTVCISPCYNLSTDFEPIGRTVQTTDSSAQTIITMDIFSTNRSPENKKNSKSGSIRMRGKSQSPRTPVPSGERPRSSAGVDEPSGKSERSSLREGGESLRRMLLPWKKLIPWKRNSNSSSSAATSPRHVRNFRTNVIFMPKLFTKKIKFSQCKFRKKNSHSRYLKQSSIT